MNPLIHLKMFMKVSKIKKNLRNSVICKMDNGGGNSTIQMAILIRASDFFSSANYQSLGRPSPAIDLNFSDVNQIAEIWVDALAQLRIRDGEAEMSDAERLHIMDNLLDHGSISGGSSIIGTDTTTDENGDESMGSERTSTPSTQKLDEMDALSTVSYEETGCNNSTNEETGATSRSPGGPLACISLSYERPSRINERYVASEIRNYYVPSTYKAGFAGYCILLVGLGGLAVSLFKNKEKLLVPLQKRANNFLSKEEIEIFNDVVLNICFFDPYSDSIIE